MKEIEAYAKEVGYGMVAFGFLYALYNKMVSPFLARFGAKTKEDKAKFDEMYHVLIGANGHSMSSRLERIEARQILHEQTNKFLMTSLDVCYWYCDVDGKAMEISTPLVKMLMRAEAELMGMNWVKFICEFDRTRIKEAWEYAIENGSDFDEVYCWNLPTGDILKTRGVVYQLIDAHNKPRGFFGTLTKIG